MSWLFKLLDAAGVNQASVDANGQVGVALPTDKTRAGYSGLLSRSEPGAAGSARARPILGTLNNRILSGMSQYLWDDTFNATAHNVNKYRFGAATHTAAMAGGQLTLNNGGGLAINSASAIQTFKHFPLFGNSELRFNLTGMVAAGFPHVANNTIEFGLFSAVITGVAAPTDGVFFRYNAAAELRGVINFNGTETQTAAIAQPSVGQAHEFMIIITNDIVEFWIDNEYRAQIDLSVDAPALGQPFMAGSQPITVRNFTGGVAPASATKFQVMDLYVKLEGPDTGRPFTHAKAGYGHMAYQGQNGGTLGTTGLNPNGAASAAAVPTNTTAALGSGLGGRFHETLTLAAGTDGIIMSYQNPAPTINLTGRNLVITGVAISGVVTAALTTNPLAGFMSLCFGHTAVSLATADSGSFVSGTAKAPRKIALCTTSIASATAAIGTPVVGPNVIPFASPIVVAPGEFVAIAHNKVTAAPATGSVLWTITIDGYFE